MSSLLTPEQRAIVDATAPVVAANLTKITPVFYRTMFANNPEVIAFFNKANQAKGRQPEALARYVLCSVMHLDKLEELGAATTLVVQKHCALGVLPEHYHIVHDNFLKAVAEVLGDAITPEVADAWSGVLMIVANHLIALEKAAYDARTATLENWNSRQPLEFVVRKAIRDTPNVTILHLVRKDGCKGPSFQPGQFITICSSEPNVAPRHYTIAAPDLLEDGAIRVCVKMAKPEGVVSSHINKDVHEGDILLLRPPFGAFTVEAAAPFSNIAVLTAGIGITPALAMLKPLVEAGKRVAHMHVDHSADSVPCMTDLDSVHCHASIRVYGHMHPDATPQRIFEQFKTSGVDLAASDACLMICTPPEMIKSVADGLAALGVAKDRIIHEAFGPEVL